MSTKRSRAAYETDLQAKQSPYVIYGKPLPPLDSEIQDNGSYVPVWKQEVTDERGRKRLHGAFTGGFSAGYFNTVGSKEGWTPSTFVSSRTDRRRDKQNAVQQGPEDFMDEEDLAEAAEAQKVQMMEGFARLGSTGGDTSHRGALVDLFRIEGENVGVRLLKRMGWREGQGIGPAVRRRARLDVAKESRGDVEGETYLFAPENTHMINYLRKNDHKGLGYDGEAKLDQDEAFDTSKPEADEEFFGTAACTPRKERKMLGRGGIGIGILNDTGSDDEDPYEIGPRISYNKVIGGGKKKKKPIVNGSIRPIFISKKATIAKASTSFRKCHDGRLPLPGFILSNDQSLLSLDGKYLPPEIPEGWKSTKQPASKHVSSSYLSTSETARASKLDPRSRATLLGEAPLPGKSVFDFLSPTARDRLASATGKTDLPPALGEFPRGYTATEEKRRVLVNQIPKLDKDVAVAALGRCSVGWMPYAEDVAKQVRYRTFLETQAGIRDDLPERALNVARDDWLKELQEFTHCALIFRPISGMMATRFTSSSASKLDSQSTESKSSESLLSKPSPKVEDPAEAAAKVGMFGPMTRSTQDFYPSRLLCKRFNVKPPAHVQLDPERTADNREGALWGGFQTSSSQSGRSLDLVSKSAMDDILRESGGRNQWTSTGTPIGEETQPSQPQEVLVDAERNEALEGDRASEAVFKAIFGDSDEDEDS